MPKQYTRQQIDQALETLPEELREAIFSVETASRLYDIYNRTGVADERAWKISEYAGYVLMGLVLPQEFEQLLQKEIKLPKQTAQEIAREINRFVFYPVKSALEQLHKMEIEVSARVVTPEPSPGKGQPKTEEKPRGEDTYREPIE